MDDTVSNMPREEEKVGGVTHTEVAHSELVRSDGEHYRMTKQRSWRSLPFLGAGHASVV